jgi:hypothetical protein
VRPEIEAVTPDCSAVPQQPASPRSPSNHILAIKRPLQLMATSGGHTYPNNVLTRGNVSVYSKGREY